MFENVDGRTDDGVTGILLGELKRSSDKRMQFFLNYNLSPLDMYNGLSQVYCINPEGRLLKYTMC